MSKETPLRRISIRSVRKSPPDLSKLGRALIRLAMAQAESEAQAQMNGHEACPREAAASEPRRRPGGVT
jgi:hypothetical protein